MANEMRESGSASILDILSDEEREQLWQDSESLNYRLGQVVCSAGTDANGVFVVTEGRARVLGKSSEGQELNLGGLEAGDYFGEEALLGEPAYFYTIRAASNLKVLKLHLSQIRKLLENRPELERYFEDYLSHKGMQAFLKKSTVLSPMNADELRSFLDRFSIHTFVPGQDVVREGEPGDSFYIIRSGSADVLKKRSGDRVLSRLGEGGFFGELALLAGYPRAATIRAASELTVFRLAKNDFDELINSYPRIKEAILIVSAGYSDLTPAIPAGPSEESENADAWIEDIESCHKEDEGSGAPRYRFHKPLRLPVILQQSIADCGAASLAMVTRYYGLKLSMNRLRDLANVNVDGASLYSLAEAAESLGFSTRGFSCSLPDLFNQQYPAIAHWEGNHFIVIYQVSGDKITVADPARGMIHYSPEEFARGWTGHLLLIRPGAKLKQPVESPSTWSRFLPYMKPYRAILTEIFIASLFIQMFGLAGPLFTQAIVDQVLVIKSMDLLNTLLAAMLIVAVFNLATQAIRQYMISHTSSRIDISMVLDFYRHVLGLPLAFFTRRRVGDIISRVNENQKIREMLTTTSLSAVLDSMTVIVYLMLMFIYSVKLAALTAAFIPLFALAVLVFVPLMKKNSRQAFQAGVEVQAHTVEAVSAMSTIKALAAEQIVRWRLEEKLNEAARLQVKAASINLGASSAAGFLQTLSSVLVLWLGARLVMAGELSTGQLMAFSVLLGSVLGPVMRIVSIWDQFQEVRIAMERLNDVLDAELEEPHPESALRLPPVKGHIRFDKVCFRYDKQGGNIIQNLSLEVYPGQTVALVGRSGCGKTTLANLLLRLYIPDSGRILVDGHDLRQVNAASLRRQIGVVPQDSVLFNGTIRENIAFHQPEVRFEQIISASMLAGAHDFISELPLGYETPIGERGVSMSGGQRQRIAIARALLGNPRVLILDEATSSLDSESERIIQNSLENILKDRSTFIIAHRLSTVRNADHIVVMDEGIIAEQGSHEELMAARGLYFYLSSQQLNA